MAEKRKDWRREREEELFLQEFFYLGNPKNEFLTLKKMNQKEKRKKKERKRVV